MRAKGLRGPIVWDVGSLADPEEMIPTGPAFLEEEKSRAVWGGGRAGEPVGESVGSLE